MTQNGDGPGFCRAYREKLEEGVDLIGLDQSPSRC